MRFFEAKTGIGNERFELLPITEQVGSVAQSNLYTNEVSFEFLIEFFDVTLTQCSYRSTDNKTIQFRENVPNILGFSEHRKIIVNIETPRI